MNNLIKRITVILVLILVIGITGCSNTRGVPPASSPSNSRPRYPSFSFNSLPELQQWFSSEESQKKELYTEEFNDFVELINSQDNKVKAPYRDGKIVPLRNIKEFSNITMFTSELYKRPWIWYFCKIDGVDCRIQLMYLSEDEIEYAKQHSASEVTEYICPGAPNVFNRDEYDFYTEIYEEEIVLKDRTVSALCLFDGDDGRLYKDFIYDDVLVTIMVKGESFGNMDLSRLELK